MRISNVISEQGSLILHEFCTSIRSATSTGPNGHERRAVWIEHSNRCREIGLGSSAAFAREEQ